MALCTQKWEIGKHPVIPGVGPLRTIRALLLFNASHKFVGQNLGLGCKRIKGFITTTVVYIYGYLVSFIFIFYIILIVF